MSEKRRTFTETFKSLLSPNIEKEREEEVKRKENQIRREILERRKKESEQRSSREVSSNQSQPTGRVKTRESNEIDNSALSDSKITANESNTVKVLKPLVKNDAFIVINHLKNNQVIMVMLNDLEIDKSRAILDIITGALHFADFKIEQIAEGQFLIDPSF